MTTDTGSGLIIAWDAENFTKLKEMKEHTESVRFIVFTTDGTRFISASWDHKVGVWDTATFTLIKMLSGH
jgi:WD40 repeat protein